MTTLQNELANKEAEENNYSEQIQELEENGIQEISFEEAEKLNNLREHQEFLYKLLTSKDSFVRKRISNMRSLVRLLVVRWLVATDKCSQN